MFLKSLQLTNYRNFTHLDVNLSPLTLMIGQNAQGKTNLLEGKYTALKRKLPDYCE